MMPIPLRYYGADTTGRFSGTLKLNAQNLPRVNPKKPQIADVLRKSLRAPEGYKVVVADLSGIELRINHFLWQEPESMAVFQQDPKADLYVLFAAKLFNKPVDSITKDERQLAKVAQLGLGYGVGHLKFKDVARLMGGITLEDQEARTTTNTWRGTYQKIVQGWDACNQALAVIHDKKSILPIDPWGMCVATSHGIKLPRGSIRYPGLHAEHGVRRMEWYYGSGRSRAKIYGAKITENLVQSLARHVLTDAILDINKTKLGREYPLAHQVHDELIYVVRDGDADEMLDLVQARLRTPPTWWPELVTWSEGAIGQTYGDAK